MAYDKIEYHLEAPINQTGKPTGSAELSGPMLSRARVALGALQSSAESMCAHDTADFESIQVQDRQRLGPV